MWLLYGNPVNQAEEERPPQRGPPFFPRTPGLGSCHYNTEFERVYKRAHLPFFNAAGNVGDDTRRHILLGENHADPAKQQVTGTPSAWRFPSAFASCAI